MNPDTAAADFIAVQDNVICLRSASAQQFLIFENKLLIIHISFRNPHKLLNISISRRGERVMHRDKAGILIIPLKQRKVMNPRKPIAGLDQIEPFSQLKTESAQNIVDDLFSIRHEKNQVSFFSSDLQRHLTKRLLREEFRNRGFKSVLHLNPRKSLGAV